MVPFIGCQPHFRPFISTVIANFELMAVADDHDDAVLVAGVDNG